jgi:hypothetical protein
LKKTYYRSILKVFTFGVIVFNQVNAQKVLLSANGPGNTYEQINNAFAPGRDVVEVPDCVHTEFGRHIEEVYDDELGKYVFNFLVHKTPDNDRCQNFDRQRIEIKTYGGSPENLKAVKGETVAYSWKFKLPQNFKVSKNFTHLHQIKSVGGLYARTPMITLTARKATLDRMELRYTATNMQSTLKTALLDLFRGQWVKVTEVIKYDNLGSYYMQISRISDGVVLFNYNISAIDMWQDGSAFTRPKWGIYRSIKNISDLRDEQVRFADFSIQELTPLSVLDYQAMSTKNKLKVNKSKGIVFLKDIPKNSYEEIELVDENGKKIAHNRLLRKQKITISGLRKGDYYVSFLVAKQPVSVYTFTIKN